MTRSEIIKFLILRTIGNFLLLFSIFGVVATFGPALFYEIQFRVIQARGVEFQVADESTPLGQVLEETRIEREPISAFAQILSGSTEQILVPKDTNFSILIPKIGATSQIVPNVDPGNEKEFLPALQKGVAHAKGTVFPGFSGTIYLFAHSVDNFWDAGRYNAVFYLLKDLKPQDEVVLFFEGKRHNYSVTETKIIDPNDVSELVKSQETGEEKLVLQTCWPPGTTWKRMIVLASPQ